MQHCVLCKETEKQLAGNVRLANTSPFLPRIPNLKPTQKKVRVIVKGRAQEQKSLGELKRSALRQTEKGQGPKKQVHWKPTPE